MTAWRDNLRFCKLYPHVLNVEGGFVDNPKDPGGATKYGVAFNFNQGYLKNFGIVRPKQVANLTKDQALEIYFRKYWLPSQADELPDARLALAYFDMVINAGQGAADKLLGRLDKKLWHFEGDGKNSDYFWGQTTQYMLHRLKYYFDLRNWGTFGKGWFNRLLHISSVLPKVSP